jgi:hypothetical protein
MVVNRLGHRQLRWSGNDVNEGLIPSLAAMALILFNIRVSFYIPRAGLYFVVVEAESNKCSLMQLLVDSHLSLERNIIPYCSVI